MTDGTDENIRLFLDELAGIPGENSHYFAVVYSDSLVRTGGSGEEDMTDYLEQTNGRLLTAFPTSAVFEFRALRTGTIKEILFYSRDDLSENCTFDVNVGTVVSDLESIYAEPGDRPVLLAENHWVSSIVNVPITEHTLVSIDVDEASEGLKNLVVKIKVDRE